MTDMSAADEATMDARVEECMDMGYMPPGYEAHCRRLLMKIDERHAYQLSDPEHPYTVDEQQALEELERQDELDGLVVCP